MQTTLTIQGMHCKACEMLTTEALIEAGAKNAKASHNDGTIVVEHDDKLTPADMKRIIQAEGYEVTGHE